MLKYILCNNKPKRVCQVNFSEYQTALLDFHKSSNKQLNSGQIGFLKYPYITAVYWAVRRKEKLKRPQIQFYFQVKQPQLNLFIQN